MRFARPAVNHGYVFTKFLPGGFVQCIKSRQEEEEDIINSFCICGNSDKPKYCVTMNLLKGRKHSTSQKLFKDLFKIN